MLRVLALVPYPTGRVPGQRYRIEQWAPLLREDAIEVHFAPFLATGALDVLYRPGHVFSKVRATLAGHARRWAELRRAATFDVAYVYREAALLGPAWIERRLARAVPLVFDFDDAIYLPASSPPNAWAAALKPRGKTAAICRLARHVMLGNETLAGFARRHARDVTVVPSTIDTAVYTLRPRAPSARRVVGWTGSLTTLPHLEALAPALRRLRERVDFELHVIGGEPRPGRFAGLDVRARPWSAETEADDLRAFDVGLMPLPDDEWSRGKCGMKALQYMALGIPPVVSPVGVNASIVEDGLSGFHARDEGEWVDRIARLLGDPALRARLGAAARRTVEADYSARVQAPRVAAVLRAAVSPGRGGTLA